MEALQAGGFGFPPAPNLSALCPSRIVADIAAQKKVSCKEKAPSQNTILGVGTAKEIILTWQGERKGSRVLEKNQYTKFAEKKMNGLRMFNIKCSHTS